MAYTLYIFSGLNFFCEMGDGAIQVMTFSDFVLWIDKQLNKENLGFLFLTAYYACLKNII